MATGGARALRAGPMWALLISLFVASVVCAFKLVHTFTDWADRLGAAHITAVAGLSIAFFISFRAASNSVRASSNSIRASSSSSSVVVVSDDNDDNDDIVSPACRACINLSRHGPGDSVRSP